MKIPKKYNTKIIVLLLSFFLTVFIGFIDYITGHELILTLFYIIPTALVAVNIISTKRLIIISTVFTLFIWFIADISTKSYTSLFYPIFNVTTRSFAILAVGFLIYNLKDKFLNIKEDNTELEKLNEEKNKFIGIAAHDLNNPIGTIHAFTDILITDYKDKTEEEVLEILGYIKDLSFNSLQLVKNVLDVSKIESGNVEIITHNQDYIEFIKKHIFYNQIIANKKEIKINLDTNIESLVFEFDQYHLSEVINNLLTNAIKFSPRNSEIKVKLSLSDNYFIKTEVIDQGSGIDKSEQNKLFRYFQKTSTRPTDGEKSTGLGLAIAKKIIDEHKGSIGVKSEIDKGSNFYYELNTEAFKQ